MNDLKFEFDLAISFAGEQRQLAEVLASRLDAAGYSIFYDAYTSHVYGGASYPSS
jgi:hypothetical protein